MLGLSGLRSLRKSKKKRSEESKNTQSNLKVSSSSPSVATSSTSTPSSARVSLARTEDLASPRDTDFLVSTQTNSAHQPSSNLESPGSEFARTSLSEPSIVTAAEEPPLQSLIEIKSTSSHSASKFSIQTNLFSQSHATSYSSAGSRVRAIVESGMMASRIMSNGQVEGMNGVNGAFSPPLSPKGDFRTQVGFSSFSSSRAPSGSFSAVKSFSKRNSGAGSYKIGFVQEASSSLRKKSMAELGAGVYQGISDVSFIRLLEWIRAERLTTLPHKGSRWDKVLIRALYFAEQFHNFEQAVQAFAHDSSSAAALGYGHAQLLLELSHKNSEALDKAFSVFYKFAMSFSSILHRSELLAATPEIREQLCLLYTDLISLVVDVSVRFYKTANGMTSGKTTLDIYELFGDTIETFRARQNGMIELIWDSQIANEDFEDEEVLDVKALSRWLAPEDRVLSTLNRDHSTFVDSQVEFTCLWFQQHLIKFIQSEKNFFLVMGQPGSGKTTLAGSIVERLQRPINRQSFDTLFCSLSPDIPTTATSLAVVKTLLYQLINLRIGNMGIYHALFRAYHQCRTSDDLKTYEEYLWQALNDSLQHPANGGNDLIVVVDGLDEIAEASSASLQASGGFSPTALLGKLASAANNSKGVRLIALSSSLKTMENAKRMKYIITSSDIRDDLHAVAMRALIHNHHFHGQKAYDQERLLDRMIQAAAGSFLWVILASEILNVQKSPDALLKVIEGFENSKASAQDLIHRLFTSLNPSENAKKILSWVLAAERPLTIDEIHTLFTVDIKNGSFSDKGININEAIRSVQPLLTIHERIVRFRHPIIHSALHEFASHGKVAIPLKDSETDLLLRALTYAKLTLKDRGSEPQIDNSDPKVMDSLFHQHHFLEYVVRYWALHFQQSSWAFKKPEDFKPSAELQKAPPTTTTLPILEALCWDNQNPVPEALELHKLVAAVRKSIFTENHPSVLQTYLSIATDYLLISNYTESAKYFYLSTKISRSVLSDIHPLTIESANHYLRIRETLITNSRTEIMTHREEILIVLITAYERQYGSTSELVIQTRKLLVELYASLKEEDRVMEVYRLIQEAIVTQYGRNSHQAQDVQGHLNITLGRGKDEKTIDGYKQSWFHDDDQEESLEVVTIASTAAYLRQIEEYIAKKQFSLAEKTYVELWMEVSSKCRTTQSVEWHEKNIEIASAYAKYLKTQQRSNESTAILTSVWQQYQSHHLSFSESIMERLTVVAKSMKSMGSYTPALAIFKFASSYYKNVRHEESRTSREIEEHLSETSSELVKQSLKSSRSVTETTTTVSESVFQDVFQSIIHSSKSIDSSTVALAKKLTKQYLEKRRFTEAISVITATLQRTWSSFLSSSIHHVTMTTTFKQESIEFIEHLAECYTQIRRLEMVEDTYLRFFRAVLITENVDQTVFKKAQTLLIDYYDKHGYADKAISIFQEILVTYRSRLGTTHPLTIETLYTLGRRCQAHPRNHPFWVDYYLQIITSLNKDSAICHKDALEATIIVATSYWEDRRYAEAVSIYKVLWNTFMHQNKEHKVFTDVKFVQTLYDRYYQCLDETKASWSEMYQVSKDYQKTVSTSFGAESSLAIEATLSLAEVTQRSEEHASEAIALYESVAKSSNTTTTRTTHTDINQALSSLYVRQMNSSKSSSMKAETVQRALSMTESQYQESTRSVGYSHESSLTQLRELSQLYTRQQKTDLAVKQLTSAISEIISKESSSQKQMESAASIAQTFRSIEQMSTAQSLVQELHRQICAKDTQNTSKWSLDLSKTNRSAIAFLAALQYHLRKDLSITFAEVMADITMEYLYFEQFHQTLTNNESLTVILLAAAPLRWFLQRNEQQEMVTVVEDQAVGLFVKRDAQDLNTLSKESPRLFIIGILDHLGNGNNKDFNRSVMLASNDSVTKLTKAKKFPEAYDIAHLGFLFASKHDGYNGPRAISMGFKLASLLVGRNGEKCSDAALRKKMLDLSNRIVKRILEICKKLEINFAQVQLYELSELSVLLGEQEDYETLEWLLTTLWQTRDAQRNWPSEVLLNLGRRLICGRYLSGHPVKAIRLAEDISYNMRRAHGPRAPVTIETLELLAQLYTSTGHSYQSQAAKGEKTGALAQDYYKKAVGIHEDILRLVVHEHGAQDDSEDDELDTAAYLLAREGHAVRSPTATPTKSSLPIDRSALALKHLRLLKLAYQRLGSWPKPYDTYAALNAAVFRTFGGEQAWKGIEGTEKWDAKAFGAGKAESEDGGFGRVEDWGFGRDDVLLGAIKKGVMDSGIQRNGGAVAQAG